MKNTRKNTRDLQAMALEQSMMAQLAAKGGCCGGSGPPEDDTENGGN